MTEKELAAFEARYRSNLMVSLNWEQLQSLTAEIRRSWAEIAQLKARLEALRRYREAMEGLPQGTLTGEEAR